MPSRLSPRCVHSTRLIISMVVASLMPNQIAVLSSPFDGISDEQLGLPVQIAADALNTHDEELAFPLTPPVKAL